MYRLSQQHKGVRIHRDSSLMMKIALEIILSLCVCVCVVLSLFYSIFPPFPQILDSSPCSLSTLLCPLTQLPEMILVQRACVPPSTPINHIRTVLLTEVTVTSHLIVTFIQSVLWAVEGYGLCSRAQQNSASLTRDPMSHRYPPVWWDVLCI